MCVDGCVYTKQGEHTGDEYCFRSVWMDGRLVGLLVVMVVYFRVNVIWIKFHLFHLGRIPWQAQM